jgi:hypothetical protein
MSTEGFNINLKLDTKTGFIIGGNWRNCKNILIFN